MVALMDSLSFITDICGALKSIKRTGWVMRGIPFPESDADHMHRCAMCALLVGQPPDPRDVYDTDAATRAFHPSAVDTTRILRMALTHDLCEALAGDVTPFCDPQLVASKHDKEDAAMQAIQKVVGDPLGEELYNLWKEYEEQQTPESIYCKDIDKFEMVVQAFEYEKLHLKDRSEVEGNPSPDQDSTNKTLDSDASVPTVFHEPLRTFFITTNATMKTPLFRRLDRELRTRRESMLSEKGWAVTEAEQQK